MTQNREQSRTLLLVDDEKNIVASLTRLLRPLRLQVLSASNAKTALDQLEAHEVDVILCDEGLPGVSGTQLLARVRERYPDVVRIMLTGQLDVEVAKAAVNEGGIFRFLTKPCGTPELLVAVGQALVERKLRVQTARLLEAFRRRQSEIEALGRQARGLSDVARDSDGTIVVDEILADMTSIIEEMEREIGAAEEDVREYRESLRPPGRAAA